jgi:AFG3 family protein
MAYAMVSKYGMSEKIGYVGYVESDYNKSYSDQTNKVFFRYIYIFFAL